MALSAPQPASRRARLPRRPVYAAALLLSFLPALAYVLLAWGDPVRGLNQVDTSCALLFCDYVTVYGPAAERILADPAPAKGYLYPALFALATRPLALLGPENALAAWGVLQAAGVLGLAAATAWALPGPPLRRIVASGLLVGLCFPVYHNLKWGQVSTLVCALAIVALALLRRNPTVSGVLLGLLGAVKVYPLYLAVAGLFRPSPRLIAGCAAALLVLVLLLPVAVMGVEGFTAFHAGVIEHVSGSADRLSRNMNPMAQLAPNVWMRLTGNGPGGTTDLVRIAGLAVAAASIGLSAALLRRDDGAAPQVVGFALLLQSLPFLGTPNWIHYFCYLPFCQLALAANLPRLPGGVRHLAVAAVAASVALSSVVLRDLVGDWQAYGAAGVPFFSNLVLLAGQWLAAVALLAGGARQSPPAPSSRIDQSGK